MPPEPNINRFFKIYAPTDINEYYRWKECAIRFLQTYYPQGKDRFVKYSDSFENKHYLPEYLSNMIGVMEACEALPSEKVLANEVYGAREAEITMVEELGCAYQRKQNWMSSVQCRRVLCSRKVEMVSRCKEVAVSGG